MYGEEEKKQEYNEDQQDGAWYDTEAEIAGLKQEIEEGDSKLLTDIVGEFEKGIFVLGDIERCAEIAEELSSDELYLSLYDAFMESQENGFDNYLWGISFEMQKISEQSGNKKIAEFGRKVDNIYAHYCARNREFYKPEVEKIIKQAKKTGVVGKEGGNFYSRLGLDGDKMKRPAELFMELALRRELANNDWKDEVQEFTSEHLSVLPDQSIGPLEIKPGTYLCALLVKSGLQVKKTFKENLETAIAEGVIQTEQQLIYRILNTSTAIQAFEDIMEMYMPDKNSAVNVLLNKNGTLKKYTIPIRDRYTFSTKEGGRINFSHEELRLMAALASYQGGGLRFLSPDKEIQVSGNEVVLEERLVLNNTVTEICVA